MTSGRRRRVVFLTEGTPGERETPSTSFRVGAFLSGLPALGIEPTLVPARPNKYRNGPPAWPRVARALTFPAYNLARLAGRMRDAARVADFDAVFLQRELLPIGPPVLERAIARRNPRIVFDLDDAIYLPPPRPFSLLVPADRAERIARLARVVTAGSATLADWAAPHCAKVRTIPTGVDTDVFRPGPRTEPTLPVVAWIGQPSNLPEVAAIAGGLRAAHRRRRFRLRIVTRLPASAALDGLDVEWVDYSDAAHPELARDADVAIMPLADTAWNRGKCGAKLLFAMASGVPVVAAPVGANREIVVDGEVGYHAASNDEWEEGLVRLLTDSTLRRTMAERSRDRVERSYSRRILLPRLAEAIHEAC